VLEAWGGQAYARDVIDALMNGPDEFRLDLTSEKKYRRTLLEITHLSTLAALQ